MIDLLAELERGLIRERTRAGAMEAKRRGAKFGRKPKLTRQISTRSSAASGAGI